MKITAEFKRSAFAVPGSVTEHLKDASGLELAVLLFVLANSEFNLTEAAQSLGTDEREFINAVTAWEKRGILISERSPSKKRKSEHTATADTEKKADAAPAKKA